METRMPSLNQQEFSKAPVVTLESLCGQLASASVVEAMHGARKPNTSIFHVQRKAQSDLQNSPPSFQTFFKLQRKKIHSRFRIHVIIQFCKVNQKRQTQQMTPTWFAFFIHQNKPHFALAKPGKNLKWHLFGKIIVRNSKSDQSNQKVKTNQKI